MISSRTKQSYNFENKNFESCINIIYKILENLYTQKPCYGILNLFNLKHGNLLI